MIQLTINSKKIQVDDGATIIEAADKADIYIPRFCYHPKLSIVANCRMCLVEVAGVSKPLPACATNATPDMVVYTQSKKALEAQRSVMEFLLINHPLDCPVCDQGGECELQDLSMGFGWPDSHYALKKRAVFNEDIGPLVETEMTRCIHCTRCVRFGEEVAGFPELGAMYRGEEMQIGTYVKHFMKSELSGNVIDLCPVGALVSKPFLFQARAWEMKEHPSISPHDCLGTNIYMHTTAREHYSSAQKIMRVVPRKNEAINEVWVSDRDRFSYQAFDHKERALKPYRKLNRKWVESGWEYALMEITDKVRAILQQDGPDQIVGIASPNATLEEQYLLQKFIRALGSNHVDYRIREQDFRDQETAPLFPNLGRSIASFDTVDAVLLIGSYIRQEQPLLNARFYKAHQEGAKIMAINSMDYSFNYPLAHKMVVSYDEVVTAVAEVALALAPRDKTLTAFRTLPVSEEAKKIAGTLKDSNNAAIVIGAQGLHHEQASVIRALAAKIGELTQATVGVLTDGANSAGAYLSGCVPHRGVAGQSIENRGLHAKALLAQSSRKVYFILNTEMENDCAYAAQAVKNLREAAMVVCLTPYDSPSMRDYADYILPITLFTEMSGTFVNVNGEWQTTEAISLPSGEARPAWKVLRVLANILELKGFEQESRAMVLEEVKAHMTRLPTFEVARESISYEPSESGLKRLGLWPLVAADAITRRANALNEAHAEKAAVMMNHKTARRLKVVEHEEVLAKQHHTAVRLPVVIDDRIADQTVYLPSGLKETVGFGEAFGPIEIEVVA